MLNYPAEPSDRFVAGAKSFSRAAGTSVALVGALVLAGWLFDIWWLKSVYGDITMKANAALSFLLAGASLWAAGEGGKRAFARRAGQACAGAVVLTGLLTLSEHVTGLNLRIDQLLFTEPAGALATTSPGRMGPLASACFTLAGTALLLLHARRAVWLAQLSAIAICLVALLPAIGYAYGTEALYGIARYTGIALHTAVSLFVLGLGLLSARAGEGPAAVISSDRLGGLMARRLLLAAVCVPFLLGWARLLAQRSGYFDLGFGTALLVLSIIVFFTAVIWRSAAKLNEAERKHLAAEAAVREKEESLRQQAALIELSHEPIFVWDLDGGIVEWNKGCEQLYGYTREEAVGRVSHRLLRTEFPSSIEAQLDALRRDGHWSGELRHTTKGGGEVIVESRQQLIESRGKRLVLETNRDVTERKRAEERFRLAVESAPNAMLMADEEGKIVLINSQAESLFGYSREELVGQSVEVLVPERFRRGHPAHRRGYSASPEAKPMGAGRDLHALRKDGTEVPVEIGLNPIRTEKGVLTLSSVVDITERKLAEAERERLLLRERSLRAQAEAASRLKDEFLATVSHELRTPLTAILGWSRMLSEGKLDEETRRRALDTIERNAQAQAQLVGDVLDVSRIITGKLRLDMRQLEPAKPVEAAVNTVRPTAEAKGVSLDVKLDAEAGPVMGDAGRLQQVVWNLLTNAVKFTPPGGSVIVRLERADGHVRLSVSDTGRGISPEFLPHVFERFSQADSSTTREHGGLGLGLSIVRHLAEMHGGKVGAESDGEGRGASFTVLLPLARAVGTKGEAPSTAGEEIRPGKEDVNTSRPALDGLRVLVVEDEEDTCELIRVIFVEFGSEVKTAASAEEGVRVFERWQPDVMVSDIGMPREDGYSFIRRVREYERGSGRHTPALALTGYVRPADREKALLAGFDAYLAKPIDPGEMAETVAKLTGRPDYLRRADEVD